MTSAPVFNEPRVLSEAQEQADTLLRNFGMGYSRVEVRWNPRLRTTMGRAYTYFNRGEGRVDLNPHLFARATGWQRIETVVHEVCHIIANLRAGRNVKHGSTWKQTMREAGFKPERCHRVDSTGLKKRRRLRATVVLVCKCGCSIGRVTPKRWERISREGARVKAACCRRWIDPKEISTGELVQGGQA